MICIKELAYFWYLLWLIAYDADPPCEYRLLQSFTVVKYTSWSEENPLNSRKDHTINILYLVYIETMVGSGIGIIKPVDSTCFQPAVHADDDCTGKVFWYNSYQSALMTITHPECCF